MKSNQPKWDKKYRSRKRLEALKIVGRGKVECIKCQCNFLPVLEINHINGGGSKDPIGYEFYRNIISGIRSIDDLELTCRLCNILHYVESLHGRLKFNITWG